MKTSIKQAPSPSKKATQPKKKKIMSLRDIPLPDFCHSWDSYFNDEVARLVESDSQ